MTAERRLDIKHIGNLLIKLADSMNPESDEETLKMVRHFARNVLGT